MNPPFSYDSTIPIQQEQAGYPLSRVSRVLLAVWSLCLLAGFAVAFGLEPDPRGYGTHERLGLPGCTFRTMFGVPCPSCGMTTSFAHFMHGRFVSAARSNMAGLLLAALCALQIPWCWLSVVTGRLWKVSQPDLCLLWLVVVLLDVRRMMGPAAPSGSVE